MRPVVLVALTGLIALAVAVLTGSTPLAVLVVAIAAIGITMLLRGWRDERRVAAEQGSESELPVESPAESARAALSPDEFSPDISGDPDGPSSDARAD